MTKSNFIKKLNQFHKEGDKLAALAFIGAVTKLGLRTATEIASAMWTASVSGKFGYNVYDLLETSANEDSSVLYNPKFKKGHDIYVKYLDDHAAAFALYKIKQCKI